MIPKEPLFLCYLSGEQCPNDRLSSRVGRGKVVQGQVLPAFPDQGRLWSFPPGKNSESVGLQQLSVRYTAYYAGEGARPSAVVDAYLPPAEVVKTCALRPHAWEYIVRHTVASEAGIPALIISLAIGLCCASERYNGGRGSKSSCFDVISGVSMHNFFFAFQHMNGFSIWQS